MTDKLESVDLGVEVPNEQASDAEPEDNTAPLSRDVVSKIVERERRKAFEKGKKEALMEQNNLQQDQQQPGQMQQERL